MIIHFMKSQLGLPVVLISRQLLKELELDETWGHIWRFSRQSETFFLRRKQLDIRAKVRNMDAQWDAHASHVEEKSGSYFNR